MVAYMAEDWDLYAVVRSYTTDGASSSAIDTTNPVLATAADNIDQERGNLLDPFRNIDDPHEFSGFGRQREGSFQSLEEIYKERHQGVLSCPINPSAQLPYHPQQQNPSHIILQEFQINPEHYTPQQQPEQLLLYREHHHPPEITQSHHPIPGGSTISFPSTTPYQPVRPRQRKIQQAKMIHRMTQEELSADSWAWRKYGQKPIKGSPYPRNYYRCSTSKGCVARRQVERCPTDPNIYVVSYSGEHSHPRPTHRSSLAGTTRTKAATKPASSSSAEPTITTNVVVAPSSSPVSGSSVSPRPESAAEILLGEEEGEEGGEVWDEEEDEDDDDGDGDVLIPNTLIDFYF